MCLMIVWFGVSLEAETQTRARTMEPCQVNYNVNFKMNISRDVSGSIITLGRLSWRH